MTQNSSPNGLTRRSFVKRSIVAGIASSSLMVFSGLVNASTTSPSPKVCIPTSTGTRYKEANGGLNRRCYTCDPCGNGEKVKTNEKENCGFGKCLLVEMPEQRCGSENADCTC